MKVKHIFYCLCIAFLLSGCSSATEKNTENTWLDSEYITIGNKLTVEKGNADLELLDNMDVLTADGLYYAAWTKGNSKPYENSEGKTIDLYDAQLYLLMGEFPDSREAQSNMDKWLDAGKTNYEVLKEEEITCGGQPYTLITYNCVSEDNPYARGVSAFGTNQDLAVCIELTCQEEFDEDLRSILTDFLEHCTYK